ncbi:hypothetical protein [Nocardioides jensenii]|uniref:hypothetical protein n=1 Tax=Nocardioides jensenii TaxID=1843 RepID=UPI000B04E315|nr:hypothetical protein [Nocardioides jensenii]
MRTKLLVAAATAIAGAFAPAVVAVGQEAAAASTVVRAPYVDGRAVYDGGHQVTINWGAEPPAADASISGRGRTSDGRLAVVTNETIPDPGGDEGDTCGHTALWLVTSAGRAALMDEEYFCFYSDDGVAYGLSDSGNTYYKSYYDLWGGVVSVSVHRLGGALLARRNFPMGVDVLDVDRNTAVLGGQGGYDDPVPSLHVWTFGKRPRVVVRGVVDGADILGHVQWRRAKSGYWTTRNLTHPKVVLWKLRFRPVAVSPDGKRVLGVRTDSAGRNTGIVQVRRLSTGALVRQLRPATKWGLRQMGWDGNGAVFGPRDTAGGSYLVRCPLSSSCAKAQTITKSAGFRVFEP